MHEQQLDVSEGTAVPVVELLRALRDLQPAADDRERIDRIRLLEELKSVVAAVQAKETAVFCASQAADQRARGVPAERAERGIAAQVGLARRISPFHARRYTGWAKILTRELPETFAQLQAGNVSEWRAMLVARETAWLSREHRAVVDAELAPQLQRFGDRRTVDEAKKIGYRLDPDGYVDRLRSAERDRRVTVRPAPDLMCRLTALLPVAAGVSAYATLGRDADILRAQGDPRTRGQLMADLMLERITGQSAADGVPVEVNLVMPADTLLTPAGPTGAAGDAARDPAADEPAHLVGYGPIPAPLARQWLLNPARTAPTWLRRMYTHPLSGQLISMDSPAGYSPKRNAPSCGYGTSTAAPCTATPRSGTPTTSNPSPTAGRPAWTTGKASARPATTTSKPPAGRPDPAPVGVPPPTRA